MDNLTHTLFAATLARTPLGNGGRGTTAALILASNAPDVEFVSAAGGAVSYLKWHRGPTHGVLGLVGLGVLTAAVVWYGRRGLDRWRPALRVTQTGLQQHDATFRMLVAVSTLGALFHILMDLATSYGTRLLSPFDWGWYTVDWLPIVDVYLLVVLAVALALGQVAPAARQRMAAMAVVLMAGDCGLRGAMHHQALTNAPRLLGPLLPQRCDPDVPAWDAGPLDRWPRADVPPRPPGVQPCLIEIAAQPTFMSPFRWRLIAHLSNGYNLREIDLLDSRPQRPETGKTDPVGRLTLRYPNQWMPQTITAAAARSAQLFLGFSRFPAARTYVDPTGAATVRWSDVRFASDVFGLESTGRSGPFTVTVRLDPGGRVVREQLGQ